jgi:hypothetical protein
MADSELLAIVWGETSALAPKDGADETMARLDAVVAKLAALAKKRGTAGKMRSMTGPRVNTPQAANYQKMTLVVDKVEADNWPGSPLAAKAALWEVTVTGAPRVDKTLPKAVSWILDQGVSNGGDFVVGDASDGRVYRLFESDQASAESELPFVSAVTLTGLPPVERSYSKIAWCIGILAAVVFLAGGSLSVWSGRSMSGARSILVTNNPATQYALLAGVTTTCASDLQAFPGGKQSTLCSKVLNNGKLPDTDRTTKQFQWSDASKAATVLDDAKACPGAPAGDGCNTIWRAAVALDQDQTWKASIFGFLHTVSAFLTGTDPAAGSTSSLFPFLMLVTGIGGLVVALGLGTKQRVTGVWIDTRNRVSLARAQVTLWTVVALAGYAAFALFNIGFAGIVSAAGDIAKFAAFPTIPASVAAALGIAAVSPMISSLILPTKDAGGDFSITGSDGDLRRRGTTFFGVDSDGLDRRPSPALASIADIFMGEEKANNDTVDVSRLQNVVITVTLVLGFFSLLVEMMSRITTETMLGAKGAVFTSLPELGVTFTSLLFVSHATYLVSKTQDAKKSNPAGAADGK